MRILFIHEVNYLTKPIFEMHELPEELAGLGHDVGFVHFPETPVGSPTRKQRRVEAIHGRTKPEISLTLFTPWTVAMKGLDRFLTAAIFWLQFPKVLKEFKPDIVVSYSVPTSGWQALRTCKSRNIPFLFRALDVSHKIRQTAFSRLIRCAERYIYTNADWVSANNPAMRDYCISMGADPSKASVELPPLNLGHFENTRTHELRKRLGIPQDSKIALYMGSFFYFSGLTAVLRSFAHLRREGEVLLLVGGGEQEAELRSLTEELGISRDVHYTGFVSFEELPGYLAIADVAFNSMEPSLVANAAFPNKVIQYMAAGLPVVSTNLAGLSRTLGQTAGLRYVECPGDVFSGVQELFETPNLRELGLSNRLLAAEVFCMRGAVVDFEKRITSVLER